MRRTLLVARSLGVFTPPPPPTGIAHGTVLMRLNFDELSGTTAVDGAGNQNGTYNSIDVMGLNPIAVDGGKAVELNGSTGNISWPHFALLTQLDAYTVVIWAQLRALPDSGANMVLACKDAPPLPPGGWSLEVWNDNGTVKGRAAVRNSAGGGGSGTFLVTTSTLAVGTGFRLALTVDPVAGAKIWHNNGAAEDTDATRTHGMQTNASPGLVGMYHGGVAAMNGGVDRFMIIKGALSQAEIEALPGWQNTTIEDEEEPPPAQFTCLTRTTGTLVNMADGTFTSTRLLSTGGSARYDARNVIVDIHHTPGTRILEPQGGFRFEANHTNCCISGGAVHCDIADSAPWEATYPGSDRALSRFAFMIGRRDVVINGLLVEGVRVHRHWDAFALGHNPDGPESTNITIRGCWVTKNRDDAFEVDQLNAASWTINDCLIDGTFAGISTSNDGGAGNNRMTVTKLLMRLEPFATQPYSPNPGNSQLIKNSPSDPPPFYDFTDCTFAASEGSIRTTNADIWRGYKVEGAGRMNAISGNRFLWLKDTTCPWSIPSGWTLVSGAAARTEWNNKRTAWLAAHPLVQRLGAPHDGGNFSL